MTQSKKRAVGSLITWGIVLIVLIVMFFSEEGPSAFTRDAVKRGISAGFLAAGYLSWGLLRFLTRARRGGPVVRDERDERIERRAGQANLIVMLCYIFFAGLGLYEYYHDDGAVPVGWLWVLAYGSVALTYVSGSIAYLILEARKID